MTPDELSYFRELAADIAANGGLNGKPIKEAIKEAHIRRQAFAQEMIDNRTERAQMARKALCAHVYGVAVLKGSHDRAIEHCQNIAQHNWRKSVGMA